jgi:hypothetical protein
MSVRAQIRPSLAIPWNDFVNVWCLGITPAFDEPDLSSALEALEQHCPEHLDALEASGVRGLLPIMYTVRFGLILTRTQALYGFAAVLERVKRGDASALSELECADALVRAGVSPSLGAPLNGKLLDAAFQHAGRVHYVEVVAPNRSDAIIETHALLARLGASLTSANRGMNVEILLQPSFSEKRLADVVSAVSSAEPNSEIREIASAGRYRKVRATSSQITPSIPRVDDGPAIAFGTAGFDGELHTVVAVRFPIDDLRAQRTFDAELHHFSRDEPNILVMDLTRVIGGIGAWMPLIERRFQPAINTRVGAAVLFEHASVAGQNKVWERWKVLPNPHARVAIPESLIAALRVLDCGPMPSGVE